MLYNQLYLSTILYCSDVWGQMNQLQRNRLHTTQRSAVLSVTGAYPSTGNSKLLNLLGLLEVNEEIEFREQTKALDSDERKRKRLERIEERRQEGEQYGASFECRLGESVSREIFFFLTGHGPFVSHSRRYNDELAVNCRFCGIFEESLEHLLLHCAAFESLEINQDTEMSTIETRCRFIAKQISRL